MTSFSPGLLDCRRVWSAVELAMATLLFFHRPVGDISGEYVPLFGLPDHRRRMEGRQLSHAIALLLSILSLAVGYEVQLVKLDTLYLPHNFDDNNQPLYGLMTGAIEQLAYEPTGKLIYGVGDGIIHVMDASDPSRLRYVNRTLDSHLDFTDVETCGGDVFISYVNKSDRLNGGVRVYRAYSGGVMEMLHDIRMGALPDMVQPTSDCTIVVAIENEAVEVNGRLIDPPGGVGIIRFSRGIDNIPEVINLDFTKFNERFGELSASGVRWVYRGNGTSNPFSNNVEPEYITFNTDFTKAYVGLQENNAIAEVDLVNNNITAVHGLGFKQWGELDPSDRDGGVHIGSWPVYGMYIPDAIHFVRWSGEDYIITANEGDAQEYTVVNFAEEVRGKQINVADIASSVHATLRAALKDDTRLGRLTFSNVDGRNSEGQYEKFYTYGGRSFSVFRASDMQRVYDSGSELEKKTAELRSDLFNANLDVNDKVLDGLDTRSDNKGPETESLAVGEIGGRLLIFVGNERPGTIFVYSVKEGGMSPVFQTMVTGVPRDSNRTWQQMYDDRDLYCVDPEFLSFYGPRVMADYPVLLTAGTVSGTISTFRVQVSGAQDDPTEKPGPTDDPRISTSDPFEGSSGSASALSVSVTMTLLTACLGLLVQNTLR